MRNGQLPVINNLTDADTASSGAVYTGQYYAASFQTTFGDGTIDGTFTIDVSNEVSPVNWTNIYTASVTNGSKVFTNFDRYAYAHTKCTFVPATTLQQRIQVQGSASPLNSTYFTFSSGGNIHNYYIWFNYEGLGVDPLLPGRTGIEIPLTGITKVLDISYAIRTQIAALGGGTLFATSSPAFDTVDVVCLQYGATSTMVDHGTGFIYSVLDGGTSYVRAIMNVLGV